MNKNIIYISSACSKEVFKKIESEKKKLNFIYGMPIAANKFHGLIMKGLVGNKCNVLALTGIPVSYKSHRKKIWKKSEDYENNIKFEYMGFINLPILKQMFIAINIFKRILKWGRENKNKNNAILFDASYVSVIPFIIIASKILHITTTAIVADIYDYMADVQAKNRSNFLKGIIRKIVNHCYKYTSSFVFLSEQMNEIVNKNNKPYIVIEGIVDSKKILNYKKLEKKFVIMYAGALRKEYGLEILLNGFLKYKNDNAELWIYGAGDYSTIIKQKSKNDQRIKFYGVVDNNEILIAERKANLLINPRPSNLEFTKFSFPSKIMEYMCSGTPVLTTKLPTIPSEYYDFLYFIDDETENGLISKFKEITSISQKKLNAFGTLSQNFIYENKNEIVQAKKIIELIGVCNEK